jgi:S-disulfanyl-L-cysteine oxidoreductase SoxD
MSSCRESARAVLCVTALAAACAAVAAPAAPTAYPGIGRAATAKELAAWDIDVRADFKGLPVGSGSVAKGQEVWEAKCASCHGVFGESNEVFMPIVGGTTKDDVASGHVARLRERGYPARTTLMKVATVSTLWDYIRRAMPWTQPKSLSVDEVYAATAYILNLGGIVGDDFVLSDKSMAEAQQRLPNRNGTTTRHALWPGREFGGTAKPDVQGSACMSHCAAEPKVGSFLPAFARNAHGNLAQQNRLVGAQHGIDTAPAAAAGAASAASAAASGGAPAPSAATTATALLNQHGCVACHGVDNKVVGPALREVAKKYAGRADAAAYLAGKIRSGGSGVWGAVPMPAQAIGEADAQRIAGWLASGAAGP